MPWQMLISGCHALVRAGMNATLGRMKTPVGQAPPDGNREKGTHHHPTSPGISAVLEPTSVPGARQAEPDLRVRLALIGLLMIPLMLTGCHANHPQSMLHPASSASGAIAWLWWFLFIVCTAVFVIVIGLTAWAILLPRQSSEATWKGAFILIAGGVIPAIILFVILLLSVGTQKSLAEPETALTIRVTGHQWWWEVQYPDQNIDTANELHIPVGQPVRLELITADVIHSVWIPNLQGKTDMIPDKTNTMWIQADRPGLYRGQCAEYCGTQHALMALEVFALPREEFDRWVQDRQTADPVETAEEHARGHEVFVNAECNNCHTIGDELAKTKRGPNLTHVGSRRMLAAGTIEHTRENMHHWIHHPQLVKPGNLMPHTPLPEEDLQPLVDYLEALK